MEAKIVFKFQRTRGAIKSFLGRLRNDPEFRLDAKRIGLIALTSLFLSTGTSCLIQSGRVDDANTLKFIVFTSFLATLVYVSAVVAFIIRFVNELVGDIMDRME